jgi:hypothetical protein
LNSNNPSPPPPSPPTQWADECACHSGNLSDVLLET